MERFKLNTFLSVVPLLIVLGCSTEKVQNELPSEIDSEPASHSPAVEWHKGYGTDNGEHVHELRQTSDGGYIAIGQVGAASDDGSNILVIKIDRDGEFLWKREFGSPGRYDTGICVGETDDGYVVGGGIVTDTQDRFLAKLGFNGEVIWQRTYDNPDAGMIWGMDVLDKGDLVLTGFTDYADNVFVFIADDSKGFIMKVDGEGEMLWEKPIAAAQGAKVLQTTAGFVICTTQFMNDPDTPQEMQLIKLDEDGNEIWNKHYGGESDEHCYDCDLAQDGGFILGGHTRSPSYGVVNWDYLLIKVDSEGNEEWHRTFGQPRGYDGRYIHDEAYGVRAIPDGGFVIAGGSGMNTAILNQGIQKIHQTSGKHMSLRLIVRVRPFGRKFMEVLTSIMLVNI